MRTIGSRKISDTSNYRCRCIGRFTLGELGRLNLGDHVNFDASAKWHLCHTDGAARMDASLTEYLVAA